MVSRFEILERIGSTAGSYLCNARQYDRQAPIVVKLLELDNSTPEQVERFRREFALLTSLEIDGIVKPATLVEESGRLIMPLDCEAAVPLAAFLNQPITDTALVLNLARQLAQTFVGLHDAHVAHCDFRPVNLIWVPDQQSIKIADLNHANTAVQQALDTLSPQAENWAFLSPEHTGRLDCPLEHRSDLYSLGILLYRLLANKLPFSACEPLEWVHCHLARIPHPLSEAAPAVPQVLSDIVGKLMKKTPLDRYQSAVGLLADLDRCIEDWQTKGHIESFAVGTHDSSANFEIPEKLYGRDAEIESLEEGFEKMATSGRALLTFITGYSGAGKSLLVRETRQKIIKNRAYFISGKFEQYKVDIAYATIRGAFRELAQSLLSESEDAIQDWRRQFRAALDPYTSLVLEVIPEFEAIIGPCPPPPSLPIAEVQHRFRRTFAHFIRVIADENHPLVLFLDDLQWADSDSLSLLESLLADPDVRHVMLIGAYRDHEVDATHPLTHLLEARFDHVKRLDIHLSPFNVQAIRHLLVDTFGYDSPELRELAELVRHKTSGNPFFVKQFLQMLYRDGFLVFDRLAGKWCWEIHGVERATATDNVVELMTRQISELDPSTQEILKLGACLGSRFDPSLLAIIDSRPALDIARQLSPALQEGLLRPTSTKTAGDGTAAHYHWLHDSIQEAAYSLIPEDERAAVHLRIGQHFLSTLDEASLEENIFEVVNHINHGASHLVPVDDRARIARLNLIAGKKATAATAYSAAINYFSTGIALLEEDSWQAQYELTYELHLGLGQCEYLSGAFTRAEDTLSYTLEHASNDIDAATVAGVQVYVFTMLGRSEDAVTAGIAGLRRLGIEMATHPTIGQLQEACDKVWEALGERSVAELIDLPPITDRATLVALDILPPMYPAGYFIDPLVPHLVACKTAELSLKHGNSDTSAYGYVMFGTMLVALFQEYEKAYEFGKLGFELVTQRRMTGHRVKACASFATMINPWTHHVATSIPILENAFDLGVESGDLTFACYSGNCLLTLMLIKGVPLAEVLHRSTRYFEFARRLRFDLMEVSFLSQQRLVQSLRGETDQFGSFGDAQFDQAGFEAHLLEHKLNVAVTYCWYYIRKLIAKFLAGAYEDALAARTEAGEMIWAAKSFMDEGEFHFYSALTLTSLCTTPSTPQQREYLEEVKPHQEKLKEWAEHCPENFETKYFLVCAEVARIHGQDMKALHLYEKAIASASENGFVQYEAISSELNGRFYLERGIMIAGKTCIKHARNCYARWGADGKVRQLEGLYPELRLHASVTAPSVKGRIDLDTEAVLKSSQAISSQIVLSELLDTLMRILIQSAGAQRACLLLAPEGRLLLAAQADVNGDNVEVHIADTPHGPGPDLPMSILTYVRRSHETVILSNASEQNPFSSDEYLIREHPRSVLCLPILRQAKLIGVFYLENNLVTNAFSRERTAVLELLSSQAAISIENAQLFTALQQENNQRRRVEDELQEREARIRQLVESNIIGIFFADIDGKITDANDAFLRIVGYAREELSRTPLDLKDITPKEGHTEIQAALNELQRTGASAPREKEYMHKDGRRVPVLVGATLFKGANAQAVAFVLDLTKHKIAEAERIARQNAEAANEAKTAFLAHMSHELRTPLNAILGFGQLMKQQVRLPTEAAEDLEIIIRNGEHLHTLINQVLDLSKIEAGQSIVEETRCELDRLLTELQDMFSFKANTKGLTLNFRYDGVPSIVQIDAVKLRQVLINLVGNALKFTERGGVTLTVSLVHTSAGPRLDFSVADSGRGIAADEIDSVFTPFRQGAAGRQAGEGTGLGLSISRNFVRLMNGEMYIESEEGKGTTIRFDIPIILLSDHAAANTSSGISEKRRVVAVEQSHVEYRILVADDHKDSRQLLTRLLTPLGFEIREALNGKEAVDLATQWNPHLIWMDMHMPELDGCEATRQIRSSEGGNTPVIIGLTASSFEKERTHILDAGCNDFIRKPFHEVEFFDLMRKHLGLEFVYEESDLAPPQSVDQVLKAVAIPFEMHAALTQALTQLDTNAVNKAISRIAEFDAPLSESLKVLADEFEYDRILQLVQAGNK